MKVLITEQLPGGAAGVVSRIREAGHQVAYCHGFGQESMGCAGMMLGTQCPLDHLDVAVVVDARTHAGPMTVREVGALCALRHGTPLVISGPVPDSYRSPWRDADVKCDGDVVDACETAVSPVGPAAQRAVAAAATRTLQQLSHGRRLGVTLQQRRGPIDVEITTDRRLPPPVCEAIRAVVRATLASYTTSWQYADVRFRPPKTSPVIGPRVRVPIASKRTS
jgi:hypothetical protein